MWALRHRRALAAGAAFLSSASGFALAQSNENPSWRADLTYRRLYYGQLGPPVPSAAEAVAGATECGPVLQHRCFLAQAGPFGGLWLRIGSPGGPPTPDTASLTEALTTVPVNPAAAIYVALGERCISPQMTESLLSQGFSFHHYRRSPPASGGSQQQQHNEFVYYKWGGDPGHDMVPAYATATEGVGGLLLSPDEREVLLIWEYGCWKMVTGSVDPGERLLGTLHREASEEVRLTIDDGNNSQAAIYHLSLPLGDMPLATCHLPLATGRWSLATGHLPLATGHLGGAHD